MLHSFGRLTWMAAFGAFLVKAGRIRASLPSVRDALHHSRRCAVFCVIFATTLDRNCELKVTCLQQHSRVLVCSCVQSLKMGNPSFVCRNPHRQRALLMPLSYSRQSAFVRIVSAARSRLRNAQMFPVSPCNPARTLHCIWAALRCLSMTCI